jgi:hypothetical protein
MSNTIAHFCNPKELPPIITIILVLGDRKQQETRKKRTGNPSILLLLRCN